MDTFLSEREGNKGEVRNFASILGYNTQAQAEMSSRHPLIGGAGLHMALMPDAHVGSGATVGSVIPTEGGIIPAAIGVDIGCGMRAIQTNLQAGALSQRNRGILLGEFRERVPSGVGKGHVELNPEWPKWYKANGNVPSADRQQNESLIARASKQFGSLGSGNHFAEVSEDQDGFVWLIVHSGSRGVGNQIGMGHIKLAKQFCATEGLEVEHPDLSYLVEGTDLFDNYVEDMLWAQSYALWQRKAMMNIMLDCLFEIKAFDVVDKIDCHHNYSEKIDYNRYTPLRMVRNIWLSRKGAINAEVGVSGIIPGSMGDLSFIVEGKGNVDSYDTAPHGAGRLKSRGVAKRSLDIDRFKEQMEGKVWQDRSAKELLDEAPGAYKPIEVVMGDSVDLVDINYTLSQHINFKGVDRGRRRK